MRIYSYPMGARVSNWVGACSDLPCVKIPHTMFIVAQTLFRLITSKFTHRERRLDHPPFPTAVLTTLQAVPRPYNHPRRRWAIICVYL